MSDCKFEVGRRYRDGEGKVVTIERIDGASNYKGVPMPIEGRYDSGNYCTFQLSGQYLDTEGELGDLIPEPIDVEPRAAPADEIIDVQVIEAEPSSVLPDSGARTEFDTGAVRDAMSGKGMPSLVPPAAIRSLSRRFEDGATKYGRDNWLKGIPLSRYADAIIRHTLAAAEGQTDEDHLGAVLWNAAAWIETERRIQCQQLPQSLDDLPYRETHEKPQQAV